MMITHEQLISDIKLLPDSALQAVGMIVKEMIMMNSAKESVPKPVYGSGRGKMRIADDFDAPLEELKEYGVSETMILSESSLAKDWDTPEEDEAWADL